MKDEQKSFTIIGIVFMVIAVINIATGNTSTFASFIAIGAAFIAIGASKYDNKKPKK